MKIPIQYDKGLLEMCGISQPELEKQIHLLEKQEHFGEPFIEELFKRYGGLSVSLINQICERSVLTESLATVSGFNKIRDEIVNSKSNPISLDEPHGGWFHLKVGYLLKSINEQIKFEVKIGGIPRDILIRDDNIHIECKSFRGSVAESKILNNLIRFGETPNVEPDNLDGFTVPYTVITSIPGWPPNPSYSINEYQRFFQKGIEEKLRQLLAGRCNLIAFNSDIFVGNMERFRQTLHNLLHNYQIISGLLTIRRTNTLSAADSYKLLGAEYALELITNRQAEIPIPEDLAQALKPQIRRIAMRP